MAAEAVLVLLQLSVYQGWEEGRLSTRQEAQRGGAGCLRLHSTGGQSPADPELGPVPSFWWSGRWPQPPTPVSWLQPSVRVRVCAMCRRGVC